MNSYVSNYDARTFSPLWIPPDESNEFNTSMVSDEEEAITTFDFNISHDIAKELLFYDQSDIFCPVKMDNEAFEEKTPESETSQNDSKEKTSPVKPSIRKRRILKPAPIPPMTTIEPLAKHHQKIQADEKVMSQLEKTSESYS